MVDQKKMCTSGAISVIWSFGIFKSFDKIESSHISEFILYHISIFINACATCSELPSNISTGKKPIFRTWNWFYGAVFSVPFSFKGKKDQDMCSDPQTIFFKDQRRNKNCRHFKKYISLSYWNICLKAKKIYQMYYKYKDLSSE